MDVAYTMREPVGANSYTWSSRGPAYVHNEICFHSFTKRIKWLSHRYWLSANCVLMEQNVADLATGRTGTMA
jgi:hypothetical protein